MSDKDALTADTIIGMTAKHLEDYIMRTAKVVMPMNLDKVPPETQQKLYKIFFGMDPLANGRQTQAQLRQRIISSDVFTSARKDSRLAEDSHC